MIDNQTVFKGIHHSSETSFNQTNPSEESQPISDDVDLKISPLSTNANSPECAQAEHTKLMCSDSSQMTF